MQQPCFANAIKRVRGRVFRGLEVKQSWLLQTRVCIDEKFHYAALPFHFDLFPGQMF
jgi:hypothetical protein